MRSSGRSVCRSVWFVRVPHQAVCECVIYLRWRKGGFDVGVSVDGDSYQEAPCEISREVVYVIFFCIDQQKMLD